jgi:hypothetical protein
LVSDSALAPFDLGKAATLAPKDEGALNTEALAADGDKLWIGFRNPKNRSFKIVCSNFCKGLFLKAAWRCVDRKKEAL